MPFTLAMALRSLSHRMRIAVAIGVVLNLLALVYVVSISTYLTSAIQPQFSVSSIFPNDQLIVSSSSVSLATPATNAPSPEPPRKIIYSRHRDMHRVGLSKVPLPPVQRGNVLATARVQKFLGYSPHLQTRLNEYEFQRPFSIASAHIRPKWMMMGIYKSTHVFRYPHRRLSQWSPRQPPTKSYKAQITFITTLRPMKNLADVHAIHQHNAIQNWKRLGVEIIVVGNGTGIAEFTQREGIRHYDCLVTKEGYPFVHDIFQVGLEHASHELIVYTNADMIYSPAIVNVVRALDRSMPENGNFLLIGSRRNVVVNTTLDFGAYEDTETMEEVISNLITRSRSFTPAAMDYFGFRRSLWIDELTLKSNIIPPFLVNVPAWDTFLCTDAFRAQAIVLDGSNVITALHQSRDFMHHTLFSSHMNPAMKLMVQRNRDLYDSAMNYAMTAFCQSDCSHLNLKWNPQKASSILIVENHVPSSMKMGGCSCCPHAAPFPMPNSLDLESDFGYTTIKPLA